MALAKSRQEGVGAPYEKGASGIVSETTTQGNVPMATQARTVTLNVGWTDCERGNTWLTNGEGDHYALIDLDGNKRLEISINMANYPGLNVAIIDADDAKCAKHIMDRFGGWHVRKCNIPSVEVEDGMIVSSDE